MNGWLLAFGWPFGLRFAEDNHVVPIMRLGRYHRVGGPGFFRIIPFMEKTLPPVKTSLYASNFVFEEVLSKDGIPFRIQITVLFTFNPPAAVKSAASVLVREGADLLEIIVRDYTNQGLRRLASRFNAEALWSDVMSTVERDLTRFLTAEMHALGLAPLRSGGVLIKELFVPEKFKRSILNARQLQAILHALAPFPVPGLIEQAIRAVFTSNLEGQELTLLMSALSPGESADSAHVLDVHELLGQHSQP